MYLLPTWGRDAWRQIFTQRVQNSSIIMIFRVILQVFLMILEATLHLLLIFYQGFMRSPTQPILSQRNSDYYLASWYLELHWFLRHLSESPLFFPPILSFNHGKNMKKVCSPVMPELICWYWRSWSRVVHGKRLPWRVVVFLAVTKRRHYLKVKLKAAFLAKRQALIIQWMVDQYRWSCYSSSPCCF